MCLSSRGQRTVGIGNIGEKKQNKKKTSNACLAQVRINFQCCSAPDLLQKPSLHTQTISQENRSVAQINDQVLINLSLPFETWGQQELSVVYGDWREGPRRLDVQLLEMDKLALLGIPAVHLGERVIAAQDGVLPAAHGEGLEHHGAARGHGLQLSEEGPIPAHHFGVADESRQTDEEVCLVLKMLYSVDVLHLRDVCASVKQLGAFVPLVDDRPLGAAGQDQVGFGRDLHVLHIRVPVPRVEWLVRVEAIAVPLVDGGGTGLGAVCYDEEGFSVDAERLNIIWLSYLEDVNALELDELVGRGVTLIDVRATKQLSHDDKELVVNDQGLADHCACAWWGEKEG